MTEIHSNGVSAFVVAGITRPYLDLTDEVYIFAMPKTQRIKKKSFDNLTQTYNTARRSHNHHHNHMSFKNRLSKSDGKRSILEITPEWIRDLSYHTHPKQQQQLASAVKQHRGRDEFPELPTTSNSPIRINVLLGSMLKDKIKIPAFSPDVDSPPTTPRGADEVDDTSIYDEVDVRTDEMLASEEEEEEEEYQIQSIPFRQSPLTKMTLEEQLFQAVSMSDDIGYNTLSSLLPKAKDVNMIRDNHCANCTLMHMAARMNNVQCMQLLVSHGADVNARDSIQATPLHYCCSKNSSLEAVLFLLNSGADVNAKDNYETFALLLAMKNYQLEIMKMLIMNKADLHLKASKGDTCLHIAARNGYLRRTKFLVEDCNASLSRLNRENEHVLFSALGNYSIVHYLCENINSYQKLTKLLTMPNAHGRTVLQEAVYNNHLESLLVIIQNLIKTGPAETDMKTVEQFIIQRLNDGDTKEGRTLIHIAVVQKCHRIAKFLSLCTEVDIDKKDLSSNTALHLAIERKDQEMCNVLTGAGKANVSKKNSQRVTCKALGEQNGIQLSSDGSKFSLKTIKKSTSDLLNRLNI
jgi:ankyrin repeat protein